MPPLGALNSAAAAAPQQPQSMLPAAPAAFSPAPAPQGPTTLFAGSKLNVLA